VTPEDISTLTLADLEAIAGRMEHAARTIRDAMALLQPGANYPGIPRSEYRLEPALGGMRQPTLQPQQATLPHLQQIREEREAELERIRKSPERTRALEQFQHDEEEMDG
jgi:hypothetical protein